MMGFKTLAIAVAFAVSATTFSGSARAGGEELAAGIIGFSAGVVAGGALSGSRYYAPQAYYPRVYHPRVYHPRRVVAPRYRAGWRHCHRAYTAYRRFC